MGARALVTGANGFIGSHLVELLQDRGDVAYAMVRRSSDTKNLAGRSVEYRYSDLTSEETLTAAMEGVDVVYHVAGATAGWTQADFDRVNAEGTKNVLAAAKRAKDGPSRVVVVSTLAAAGPCTPDRGRREYHRMEQVTPYGVSKLRAEREALRAARDGGPEVVIVRPPLVYGPRDTEVAQIIQAANWWLIVTQGFSDFHMSAVHPHDLCRGIVLAADKGLPLPTDRETPHVLDEGGLEFPSEHEDPAHPEGRGVYYITDGGRYTLEEFGRTAAQVLGKRAVKLPVPTPVAWTGALFTEWFGRLRGRPPVFSRHKVREAAEPGWVAEIDKAREELDFRPEVPLETGLEETVRWMRDHGAL